MATVMKTTRDVKGVGLPIPRPDSPEKVTGQVQYVADIKPKGLLHAKLLRSPHAHARIIKIDTSRAKALPGVRAVVTAADIPQLKKKAPTRAHAVLAIDRVVFVGQPVAAVAADELAIAEEALDLIDVQYEVLAASVDPLKSMQPGAPPVAELGTKADTSEAQAHSGVAAMKSDTAEPAKAVNVSQQARIQKGDVAKAFAESDHVLEKTYRVPMVHQGYLEPHAVLAQWDANGLLTLWSSTQGSFNTRSEVADVLEIPENSIRVIPVECGGGFGGKIRALCEPITAVLARVTKRPVRYVMTRREELDAGMPAPQVIIRLKTGVKRDGTLMALEAETVLESGAFSGAVLTMGAVFIASVYKWPNFDVRGFEVLTHKPSIAAYRAPTAPQTFFAVDSHMQQIADALQLDPVEFRLRHMMQEGDPMANGQPWQSNGAKEVLRRIAEHPLWKNRAEWKATGGKDGHGLRGTGLGVGGWIPGLQPTGATVRLNPDGSLSVLTGQVDIAGTNIALAQIAASAYGLDIDKVRITTGDTDVAPMTGLSAGSKTIYTVGAAVLEAAQDARRQTLEIAAGEMEARGRQGCAGQGRDAGLDRQEGQPLHVEGPARPRCEPSRLRQAGAGLRGPARADRDRSRYGRAHAARLRGGPGRGQGDQPARRRRPDAGRRRSESRNRADRGDDVRRHGPLDERQPARLPEADGGRSSEHRDDHRGGAVAGRTVRRPWGRRAADHSGAGGDRERDRRRDGRAADGVAADAGEDRAGARAPVGPLRDTTPRGQQWPRSHRCSSVASCACHGGPTSAGKAGS